MKYRLTDQSTVPYVVYLVQYGTVINDIYVSLRIKIELTYSVYGTGGAQLDNIT